MAAQCCIPQVRLFPRASCCSSNPTAHPGLQEVRRRAPRPSSPGSECSPTVSLSYKPGGHIAPGAWEDGKGHWEHPGGSVMLVVYI